MQPDEKPIKLVRNLLALAERSPFLGEKETAQAKADLLMARHGLTLADVRPPTQPAPQAVAWPMWQQWQYATSTTAYFNTVVYVTVN